ncbi:MAG: hypothetical protein SNG38_05930 [Rikenellaceae bacterium]
MKKLLTLFTLLLCALNISSCSDNDDGIYVSTSGDGSVVVDYDYPIYLYRMVLFTSDTEQLIYLMGSSAYVNADGDFSGRGAVVKFTIPNSADNSTITAQSFDIDNSDYFVSYSTYVNYSAAEDEDDFISLSSGTVIIRKSGSYYDIRLLGISEEDENILISYRGYIYRVVTLSDESSR